MKKNRRGRGRCTWGLESRDETRSRGRRDNGTGTKRSMGENVHTVSSENVKKSVYMKICGRLTELDMPDDNGESSDT